MKEATKKQLEAINALEGNIAVMAGAGSGKTRVLVERFVNIIKNKKASANEIMAITFTRKAAWEMVERIRNSLLELAKGEEKALWQEQLDKLSRAQISTIDSFCSRVVRENPVESGLPPEYAMAEEYEMCTLRLETVEDFLEQSLDDEDIKNLLDNIGLGKLREVLLLALGKKYTLQSLPDLTAAYKKALTEEQGEKDLDAAFALSLATSLELVLKALFSFAERKQKQAGLYSFADIMEIALRVLQKNKHILDRYRAKFKFIMVDEFQDTSPEQKELVYLLAGGDSRKLEGERLFIVGDDKQSIYRFRGADVGVFAAVQNDIKNKSDKGKNKIISMDENFRSSPEIIAFCNYVFEQLMSASSAESGVKFQKLLPRLEPTQLPELKIIGHEGRSTGEGKEEEASYIAQKCAKLHEEKGLAWEEIAILVSQINDAQPLEIALREAGLPYRIVEGKGFYERQEILDLLNLLTFIAYPARDLELAGVLRSPYFGLTDDSLTALFAAKGQNPLWQALQEIELPDEEGKRLRRAREKLSGLLSLGATLPLADLCLGIKERLCLPVFLASQEFAEEKEANVEKLLGMATEFAMKKGGSLPEFIGRIELLRENNVREDSAKVPNSRGAIQIMTIHKSKGLEFPAVFLPQLQRPERGDRDFFNYADGIGIGIRIKNSDGEERQSKVFQRVKEQNERLSSFEKIRLLYVAMTRAKQYLFLSGLVQTDKKEKKGAKENSLETLIRLLKDRGDLVKCSVLQQEDLRVPRLISEVAAPLVLPDEVWKQVASPEAAEKTNFSATSLADYDSCPRRYFYSYLAELPELEVREDFGSGISASLLGLVIHSTLENLKYKDLKSALEDALVSNEVAPSMKSAVRRAASEMLRGYLESDLYKGMASWEYDAEQGFACAIFPDEDFVFSGFMDRVVHQPDGRLRIVDYKTGRPPESGEEKTGYMRQLLIYAAAARELYGKEVAGAELHFLQNNSRVELTGDYAQKLEELRQLCREISSKNFEENFSCNTLLCSNCPYAYLCTRA